MPWTRPSDWLAMPATAANQVDILTAVTNDDSNFCALSANVSSGSYQVDWGDGNTTTHSSGATAEHKYAWGDLSSDTLTTYGYRQALIKITPVTGGATLTALDFGKKHSQSGLNSYTQPWLDLQVNASACATFTIHSTMSAQVLQRCNIVAIGAITTLQNAFQYCYSLAALTFPSGSLASVTNMTSAFQQCSSLAALINAAFPITVDLSSMKLSATEIDAIFTALPTVSGKTITVTGNWGAATCTTSIATGKGWTVAT